MTSKRTISYIGLWALILPWLGLTWEVKAGLFSLTGVVLLVIGNKQYFSGRKQQQHSNKDIANNVTPASNSFSSSTDFAGLNTSYSEPANTQQPVLNQTEEPPYMQSYVAPSVAVPAVSEKVRQPRTRKKVEMVAPSTRVRNPKTNITPTSSYDEPEQI